jgi:DNA-nicking Smr family endonuclease
MCDADDPMNDDFEASEPVPLPIDGILDLHTFSPKEIKELIPDYIEACRERNLIQIRIIHGKGIGNLRRTVHSILSKHSDVLGFRLAGPAAGGWGATEVDLRPIVRGGRTRG